MATDAWNTFTKIVSSTSTEDNTFIFGYNLKHEQCILSDALIHEDVAFFGHSKTFSVAIPQGNFCNRIRIIDQWADGTNGTLELEGFNGTATKNLKIEVTGCKSRGCKWTFKVFETHDEYFQEFIEVAKSHNFMPQ